MGPGGPQLKGGSHTDRVRGPCGPRGHAFKGPRTWWVQGSRKVKGPRVGFETQSSSVHRPEGSKAQGSTGLRGPKFKGPQARGVQSSRVHGPDLSKAQARARGPNGPIDPNLNQGNLGPRASWLQNARAQEESACPLGPTGPHQHANLFFHCQFFFLEQTAVPFPSSFPRCSCFAARRPLALGMADLMWVDLGSPMRAPPVWMPRLPWFPPKWRCSTVQSDSNLLLCTHPPSIRNRRPGRWHS